LTFRCIASVIRTVLNSSIGITGILLLNASIIDCFKDSLIFGGFEEMLATGTEVEARTVALGVTYLKATRLSKLKASLATLNSCEH
jgi:hypothetical protein